MDVSIVSSGHDVADARLHREVAAMQRLGLSVEVLGLGIATNAPPGVTVRTRGQGGLLARAWAALALPWQAHGGVLVCFDPDVVPSATCRRLTGRRLVVDVHEDYLALLVDRPWASGAAGIAGRMIARTSTRLAARADLTVVADDHVPPRVGRRRLVVPNLPDRSLLPAPTPLAAIPRALYVGDLRASRGLFTMLDALAAAPGWELDLVGPVARADQDRLDGWLASSPARARVRLHGRLEPRAAWQLAAGAWVGLALLDRTPAFEAAIPTKVYEYLACGLAVLVTPLPRMAELVTASGSGQVVETAEQAATALLSWSSEPASMEPLRAGATSWSATSLRTSPYDDLAQQVLELSRRTITPRPAESP